MPIKVTLHNSSKITKRTPNDRDDTGIGISRHTYQKLGSLIQNKELEQAYTDGTLPGEYVRLLDDLNDLYLKVNYPDLYPDLVIKEGIIALDEYLGNLGITQEYSYSKDTVNIPPWLSVDNKSGIRWLSDLSDDTILMDGTEYLVSYS